MPILFPGPILGGRPSIILSIKVVPRASRDGIAGPLGDRLKVRTFAPPEGGKANKAIAALLAAARGLKATDIEVISGHSHPEKQLRVRGITEAEARAKLSLP